MMKGIIMNFRSARHHQDDNQMIVLPEGAAGKEAAQKLVGKTVVFKTEGGKEIKGKVTFPHGSKGAVRVLFERGMPGQSITREVEIN